MNSDLIEISKRLRHLNDYTYVLAKYVDRDFWINNIAKYFNDMYIENFTDYNDSTCFTYIINIGGGDVQVGSKEFNNYLEIHQVLYRLQIQISIISPYLTYKFIKYTYKDKNVKMEWNEIPYLKEHSRLLDFIKEFAQNSDLNILYSKDLTRIVEGIELESKKENVTVFNCLFEDNYI